MYLPEIDAHVNKGVRNLIRRGFAYEALSKMQEALNDFLSARNLGATAANVMQAISRCKKEAKQPKVIPTYEFHNTAPAPKAKTSSRRMQRRPSSAGSPMPPQQKTLDLFGGLQVEKDAAPEAKSAPHVSPDSANGGGVKNLFDLTFDGDKSEEAPSQTAPKQQSKPAGNADWLSSLANSTPDDDVLQGFNRNEPVMNGRGVPQGGARESGIRFDDLYGENSNNNIDIDVGGSTKANDAKSDTKRTAPAQPQIFENAQPTSLTDGAEGSPITQMTHILQNFDDQTFWHFQDNLAPNQYHYIPRERSQAIRYLIKLGINNPGFVTSWETSLEEKRHKVALDKWEFRAGIRKDLMALLSGLHNLCELVPWHGRKWKRVGLGDLQDLRRRKLHYKKAMLVVHPDHNQSAPPAQRAICERAFTALKEALQQEPK